MKTWGALGKQTIHINKIGFTLELISDSMPPLCLLINDQTSQVSKDTKFTSHSGTCRWPFFDKQIFLKDIYCYLI